MSKRKTSNRPTHDAFHITGEGENAFWTKIGAAWDHEDGDGFTLKLELVPVRSDGRIVLRKAKAKSGTGQ
jgi:hypothetical protein